MANIPDGTAFVAGRSRERVIRLLAIADELGIDQASVKTANGGYVVPETIADAFIKESEEVSEKPEATKARAPRKKKEASE